MKFYTIAVEFLATASIGAAWTCHVQPRTAKSISSLSKLYMSVEQNNNSNLDRVSRRKMFSIGGPLFIIGTMSGLFGKYPGTMPTDLGVRADGTLTTCPSTPNCYSSSGPDKLHTISPWKCSEGGKKAFEDLKEVIETYEVGQGGVDGGGFKLITADSDKGYLYAQFESKTFGFIDDVEFAVSSDGNVQIHSASRLGESDFGVNSIRLNYIADRLVKKSGSIWSITKVKPQK